jgi:hypothetical protein
MRRNFVAQEKHLEERRPLYMTCEQVQPWDGSNRQYLVLRDAFRNVTDVHEIECIILKRQLSGQASLLDSER